MNKSQSIFARSLTLVLIPFLTLVAGCGGEKLAPVSGRVLKDGSPLTSGSVTFHPDESKGNNSTSLPGGEIGADGTYQLFTAGEEGAPFGWYKVTVFAEEVPASEAEGADAYALPTYVVPEEYTMEQQTPVAIEVKEGAAPGSYDITIEPVN